MAYPPKAVMPGTGGNGQIDVLCCVPVDIDRVPPMSMRLNRKSAFCQCAQSASGAFVRCDDGLCRLCRGCNPP